HLGPPSLDTRNWARPIRAPDCEPVTTTRLPELAAVVSTWLMPRAWSAGRVLKSWLALVAGGKPADRVPGFGPGPPRPPPNAATSPMPRATIDTMGRAARTAQCLIPALDNGDGSGWSRPGPRPRGRVRSG